MQTVLEVKDNRNMIIGWCRDTGDTIQATHRTKGFVGRYVKSSNITYDKYGKLFCYGDGTQSLIRDADR